MTFKTNMQGVATRLINNRFVSVSSVVTFKQPIQPAYDAVEGATSVTYATATVKGVVTPWEEDNAMALRSNAVLMEEVKLIVSYADIEASNAAILPIVTNNYLIFIDGAQYDIISFKLDAAKAAYTFRLRVVSDE